MQIMSIRLKCIIEEQNTGMPDVGDYCTDGDYLYRVESTGHRFTRRMHAEVVRVSWDACSMEEQHSARVVFDDKGDKS